VWDPGPAEFELGTARHYATALASTSAEPSPGKRLDILAWNVPASALYTDFDAYQPSRRNYVYVLFTIRIDGDADGPE
jgi:hypothetical protein